MFAIEKDEEYYPQFTQCIKEGKEDDAIASGLEAVKLAELRESDLDLYSVMAK